MPPAPIRRLESAVAFALLALLAIGCVLVVRPLATAMIVATLLAVSLAPLHARVADRFGGRRSAAAAALIVACLAIAGLPLVLVGVTLADNAEAIVQALRGATERGLPPAPAWLQKLPVVGPPLFDRWQLDAADSARLAADLKPALAWLRGAALHGGGLLLSGTLQLAIALLLAFFLLRDGPLVARRLEAGLARLAGPRGPALLGVAGGAMRGVVYGVVGTAAAQGLAASVALALAGVPGAILLGFLTFVAACVPMGATLIWLPAALWLVSTGATGKALFLALWGLIVLLGMDKLLKPVLMSRGVAMPLVLVIVGVLGGAIAFGFLGLFTGPTLLAVAWAIGTEWTALEEQPA